MKRKGISPLIAAVLLIAFTISIAALVGPFFIDIFENSQGSTSEQLSDVNAAANANLDIKGAKYDPDSGNYTVTFQNTGDRRMENFTATAVGEKPYQEKISIRLSTNEIHTFTLETNNSTDEEKLRIESENLPVRDEENLDNIITGTAPVAPSDISLS